MKKLRAKNNRAAGKVRVKKREEERNLEITEKDMEQTNRELTAHANELASQVHSLKMQLLQHVGCDCVLIQEYIASQAQRYVKTSTK
jgi:cell division protein FtsB